MVTVGYVSIRAMFLLIDCKYLLMNKRRGGNGSVNTYLKSNVSTLTSFVKYVVDVAPAHSAILL